MTDEFVHCAAYVRRSRVKTCEAGGYSLAGACPAPERFPRELEVSGTIFDHQGQHLC